MGNSTILLGCYWGGGEELAFWSWSNKDLINRNMMGLTRFQFSYCAFLIIFLSIQKLWKILFSSVLF